MSTKLLLPIMSSLALLSGCGDDTLPNNNNMGDGGNADACGGHGQPECMGEDFEYLNHEGGEIRLEYVETPNGQMQIILYAWFLSSQTPEKVPYPPDNVCTNILASSNTQNPGAAVNDSRTYMDVGDTITLSYQGQDIVLNKYTNIADKRGLIMDIGYMVDGAPRGTAQPSSFLPGAEYTVTMSGKGVFPAKLKVPAQWTTIGGSMNFGGGQVNNLQASDSIVWNYAYVDEELTKGAVLIFNGNNAAGVRETYLCLNGASGRIEIPAAEMALLPRSGTVQAATSAHQKVNWNGRVVDVIGLTCRQNPYTIQ